MESESGIGASAPLRYYRNCGLDIYSFGNSRKKFEFIIQFYSNINVVSMARIRGTRFINHRTFSSQDFFHCEVIYSWIFSFVAFSDARSRVCYIVCRTTAGSDGL